MADIPRFNSHTHSTEANTARDGEMNDGSDQNSTSRSVTSHQINEGPNSSTGASVYNFSYYASGIHPSVEPSRPRIRRQGGETDNEEANSGSDRNYTISLRSRPRGVHILLSPPSTNGAPIWEVVNTRSTICTGCGHEGFPSVVDGFLYCQQCGSPATISNGGGWIDEDSDDEITSYEELVELQERLGNVGSGLSDKTVEELLSRYKYQYSEEICCICQETYKAGEDVVKLECRHMFHYSCIKRWLTTKNSCPLCKNVALKKDS
ncbi:PREDICTED: E3 ubiquitin-protein ligase RLIM-like [Tarenaya hassleriana]|uniref:E3 ubiquitin-protein ligase RLIM-like n=1 Tax=Tarenaya hassleriana TaxID=28532 RepID=UPI00053CA026|nr:PREDICTED: E3 ubiquitin-protein ligase RLIM-like [Tarenaya hassleriana]